MTRLLIVQSSASSFFAMAFLEWSGTKRTRLIWPSAERPSGREKRLMKEI